MKRTMISVALILLIVTGVSVVVAAPGSEAGSREPFFVTYEIRTDRAVPYNWSGYYFFRYSQDTQVVFERVCFDDHGTVTVNGVDARTTNSFRRIPGELLDCITNKGDSALGIADDPVEVPAGAFLQIDFVNDYGPSGVTIVMDDGARRPGVLTQADFRIPVYYEGYPGEKPFSVTHTVLTPEAGMFQWHRGWPDDNWLVTRNGVDVTRDFPTRFVPGEILRQLTQKVTMPVGPGTRIVFQCVDDPHLAINAGCGWVYEYPASPGWVYLPAIFRGPLTQ